MICDFFRKLFGKKEPVKEEPIKEEPPVEKVSGYQVAQKYIGKNEEENAFWIRDSWAMFGRDYDESVEWCSLFIMICEYTAGNIDLKEIPDNFEVARSWWNHQMPGYSKVEIGDVTYGDIIISSRGESWQGHVGYFGGYRGSTQYYCLGGNKSDQVKMGYLNKDKIVGIIRYDS